MELELRNIHKSFGDKKVLEGISFHAAGGRAFGLLGRNGAGKTTSIDFSLGKLIPVDKQNYFLDNSISVCGYPVSIVDKSAGVLGIKKFLLCISLSQHVDNSVLLMEQANMQRLGCVLKENIQ